MKERGGLLIENIIAVGVLAIVSTSFLPLIPNLSMTAYTTRVNIKLVAIGEYIGAFLFRWAAFDPDAKPILFSEYDDTDSFDTTGERRVNSLAWTQDLMSDTGYMTDHYKTNISFHETDSKRAVVRIEVWYDDDLDGLLDTDEIHFSYSTMLTEFR